MPNKTRKEKIAAEYRRRLKLLENQVSLTNQTTKENKSLKTPATTEYTGINKKINRSSISDDKESEILNKYFFIDLRKSFIFIFLIIVLEFFLYFATIKNYLKF